MEKGYKKHGFFFIKYFDLGTGQSLKLFIETPPEVLWEKVLSCIHIFDTLVEML